VSARKNMAESTLFGQSKKSLIAFKLKSKGAFEKRRAVPSKTPIGMETLCATKCG